MARNGGKGHNGGMFDQAAHTDVRHTDAIDSMDVPVRTRVWCTILMVAFASFANLMQAALAGVDSTPNTFYYVWCIICTLLALPSGLLLLLRSNHPAMTFWLACACTCLFPFDALMTLMALTSLLARRNSKRLGWCATPAAAAVTVWCQLRDVLRRPDASLWQAIFTRNGTGSQYGTTPELFVGRPVIMLTASVFAGIGVALSVLIGLHIRQRAITTSAEAKADAAQNTVVMLRQNLDSQQFADALAAEAHDTLAHSLSLLALNASALQETVTHLQQGVEQLNPPPSVLQDAHAIAVTAGDIRKQAAGALDEAHTIIDTLRHPEQAAALFAPSYETSLTRTSLNQLIDDSRAAGMRIDSWIDIRDLSSLDDEVSKLAYRVVQEALTNARRHAAGTAVALQVDASPKQGVHIHMSNEVPPRALATPPSSITSTSSATSMMSAPMPSTPISPTETMHPAAAPAAHDATTPEHHAGEHRADGRRGANAARDGEGLTGLAARVRQLHGNCGYGFDDHHVFHVDVALPWTARP